MTTDERLTRVESQLARARSLNSFLVACMVLCLMLCIFLSLGGWYLLRTFPRQTAPTKSEVGKVSTTEAVLTKPATKEIRASAFVVEDEDGKTRATLDASNNVPALRLFDSKGHRRFSLVAHEDSLMLMVDDANQTMRFFLDVTKSGPFLSMLDENGMPRLALSMMERDAGLTMVDQNKKKRIGLRVSEHLPSVTIYDENEKPSIELAELEGQPILRLWRDDGTEDGILDLKRRLSLLEARQDASGSGHTADGQEIKDIQGKLLEIEGRVLVLEGALRE
jgi:hypothetical protein